MFSSDTLKADIIDDVPRRRSSIFFPSQSADYQISRKGSVVGVSSPEIDESIHEYTTYQLKLNDQLLKFKVSQLIKVFIIKLKRNSPFFSPQNIFESIIVIKDQIGKNLHSHSCISSQSLIFSLFTYFFYQLPGQQPQINSPKFNLEHIGQQLLNMFAYLLKSPIKYRISLAVHIYTGSKSIEIFTYATLLNVTKIIILIFFCIFPTSRIFAAVYFALITISMSTGTIQMTEIQATYAYTLRLSFIWKLTKIIIKNFIFIHVVATILLAVTEADQTQNWLISHDLHDALWYLQYNSAFYWATVTITTIGFGDFTATNQVQKLTISLVAMFSCIFLAFNISQFSNVFGDLRNSYQSIRQKLITFRRVLKRDFNNNVVVNPVVRKKVIKYIQQHMGSDNTELTFIQKNQFLQQLPSQLRHQYYCATNISLFSSVGFIKELKLVTLSALYEKFNVVFLSKSEQVNDIDDKIIILEEGLIGLTYYKESSSRNGEILDFIKSGRRQNIQLLNYHFLNIYKQQKYRMPASSYSIIWTIKIEDFIDILEKDVIDFQYYFNVYHKFPLNQHQWESKICERCSLKKNKQFHNTFQCPKISCMPLRSIILHKYLNTNEILQHRMRFERNKTTAPRISVIKYWKKFLQKNYELQTKRNEASHLHNVTKKKMKIISYKKSYNLYLQRQKMNILAQKRHLNFEVDVGFSFQFYMPKFNPQNLIFTPVHKLLAFDHCIVQGILRNVLHIKGQKFNFKQVDI